MSEQEWHVWRRAGVGGSDISALLGLSAYASPTSLYFEKVGLLDDDHDDSPRQRIGRRMEQVLALEFHDETGLYVVGEQSWCEHPDLEWARCTPDGYVVESPRSTVDDAISTIEFKTDGRFGWDEVPANIRAQCIWQQGVTGMRGCYLVVMFAGFRVQTFRIEWDESDWQYMLGKARTFWLDHVLPAIAPPLDDHPATTEALTRLFDPEPGSMLDADADSRGLVFALQAAKFRLKAAEVEEARLGNELRALLGDRTDLIDGWTQPGPRSSKPARPVVLASWRPQAARRIDTAAFRENEPQLAEKYSVTTTTRVLRVSNLKEPA